MGIKVEILSASYSKSDGDSVLLVQNTCYCSQVSPLSLTHLQMAEQGESCL